MGKYKRGEPEDFSADRVKRSVRESLDRLQLSYLDLVHCHDIESAVDMQQARAAPSIVVLSSSIPSAATIERLLHRCSQSCIQNYSAPCSG